MSSRTPFVLVAFLVVACHRNEGHDADASTPMSAPAETFIDRFAVLYCERAFVCESELDAYTEAECRAIVKQSFWEEDFRPLLDSGALAFDAARAEGCLDLLEASEGCAYAWAEEYCFEDAGPFVGAVAAGGACDSDSAWMCAPGTRCSAEAGSGACGVCDAIALVGLGEPCERDDECLQSADALAHCGEDPLTAQDVCLRWTNPTEVGLSDSCVEGDVLCEVGTACDWNDTETCVTRPALGDDCEPFGGIGCAGGAACLEDGASTLGGVCAPLVIARNAGDACGAIGGEDVTCLESAGLVCDEESGVCVSLASQVAGASCDVLDCADGFHCDSPGPGLGFVCVAKLADGAACDSRRECASDGCFGPDGAAVCGSPSVLATVCAP